MNNIAAKSDGGYKPVIYAIQNLIKQYPNQAQPANDNITLRIHQGEIFGILGDNRIGKFTICLTSVLLTLGMLTVWIAGSKMDWRQS